MAEEISKKKILRFSLENLETEFKECANENLFDPHLCPSPGVTAEILKDYVTINNFLLKIFPVDAMGITGVDEENRTAMRSLLLNESDFTGMDASFVSERLL